jgi:hypothetical protein
MSFVNCRPVSSQCTSRRDRIDFIDYDRQIVARVGFHSFTPAAPMAAATIQFLTDERIRSVVGECV